VRFHAGDRAFIGEIKITGWLRLEQAFRMALGQLLEYRHLRCPANTGLVMFLDQGLDSHRLGLASSLGIAVVYERASEYVLQNPEISEELENLFGNLQRPKAA
jgi:hypothetical protein